MKQENQKQKQLGMALLLIPFLLFTILLACSTAEDINKNELTIPSENESFSQTEEMESSKNLEIGIGKIEEVSSTNVIKENATNSKRKKFNFHANGAKWKAYFEEGKLVELFKDGTRLTEDELAEYEDFIFPRRFISSRHRLKLSSLRARIVSDILRALVSIQIFYYH